jgi:hypothetical protein
MGTASRVCAAACVYPSIIATHEAGENPPGGTELPPANTAPGASMRTSSTVGFGAITIWAARSCFVILATRSAAIA